MERNNLKWFIKKLKVILLFFIEQSEKNQVDHIKNKSARQNEENYQHRKMGIFLIKERLSK